MYGLKSDPRSGFFLLRNSRCGAERISVLAKTHGLLRSGFSALTMTRIGAERNIRTNLLSRIRTDLPEIVTERIGSDIRSWKMSRIITERIGYPLVENVTDYHGADIRLLKIHGFLRSGYPSNGFFTERITSLRQINRTHRGIYPRCTGATIR